MTAITEKPPSARCEWGLAILATLVVLWLHIHFWQHAGGLWRDEVNTVNLANTHSLATMTHDSFPVLVPCLLDVWGRLGFGSDDLELRFAGVLLGLTIPLAFWRVARSTGQPPLFSLVFFGLNVLFIRHGDSLRAYGLGSALIVFAFAAMWSFLKAPTWGRALVLAVAATLSVQALYQNAVLFFAICLAGFAVCWQRRNVYTAVKIICAGLLAAASLLPYHSNFAGLPQAAVILRSGFSTTITTLNFTTATGFPYEFFSTIWELLAVIVAGLALLALAGKKVSSQNEIVELRIFAGITPVAAITLFLTFLWLSGVSARPQYFVPPLALVCVCFDAGIALPRLPRVVRVTVLALLVATAVKAVPMANQDLRARFSNVDVLAGQVAAQSSPQDYVVVTPWYCGLTFDRYFHGNAEWQTLPPLDDHRTHRYDLLKEQMLNTNSLAPIFDKISKALRSGHRVWVVGTLPTMRTNAMQPPVMPPPPLPGSGWADGPYSDSWAARTEYFIKHHSDRLVKAADDTNQPDALQENLHLYQAKGWHD